MVVRNTDSCQSQHVAHHIKFAGDSVVVSLLCIDEPDHGHVLIDFSDWCKAFRHFFSSNQRSGSGACAEVHTSGSVTDEKLTFERHVDVCLKKAHQRIYFCCKFLSFNTHKTLMKMFYCCSIESILTSTPVTWYALLNHKTKTDPGYCDDVL